MTQPDVAAGQVADIAVVGAGPAGSLVAVQLLRALRRERRRGTIELIDPSPAEGAGVAFGTTDERHLLNVRVAGLDAHPDEPGHFLAWARAHVAADVQPGDFLPRAVYGAYLQETLRAELEQAPPGARVTRRRARVLRLDVLDASTPITLALDDGTALAARRVVLATGSAATAARWAPAGLADHPRFVADPWDAAALAAVPDDGDVLLVGSGLTAVDLAVTLARPGRTVHAVSRHGRLPRAHRELASTPAPAPAVSNLPVGDPEALRGWVVAQLRDGVRREGDWRPTMDSLRSLTAATWRACGEPAQRDLLTDAWAWNVLRHRCAPATAAQIGRLRSAGALTVTASTVVGWQPDGDQLRVELANGSSRLVGTVVSCTGPDGDVRQTTDPLLADLLSTGWATAGPHGLGLRTAEDGRLTSAAGPNAPVWTLGALRRGQLWESTAVPEIREQAAALATSSSRRCLPSAARPACSAAGPGRAARRPSAARST